LNLSAATASRHLNLLTDAELLIATRKQVALSIAVITRLVASGIAIRDFVVLIAVGL
jgi:DNA-binding transcriptional ArsR family regulator